jgi:hypothetical protein
MTGTAQKTLAKTAEALKEVTRNEKGYILNPWTCLPVKNEKYAKECTEVYLCGKGANQISTEFRRFPSLEVLWFNQNRLTRFDNMEANFRVQEVYVEHNRLVSLKGLLTFKFLRVLLARGNQLRNLDKQINLLRNFSFLKRLDLSDNAAADEPDYQLRIIYNLPQVEDLDRKAVKPHERIKAAEVVPNLDKVIDKPQVILKKFSPSQQFSAMEKHCFMEAKNLRARYKREEEEEKKARYASSASCLDLYRPDNLPTEAWNNARQAEIKHLSSWESSEVFHFLYNRYVEEKDPHDIFKESLTKSRGIVEGDAPKAGIDAKTGVWEETAKMKEAKAKRKEEVGKMTAKGLDLDQTNEIIGVLADGGEVMLGRILDDVMGDFDSALDADPKGLSREDNQKRAFWKPFDEEDEAATNSTNLYDFYKWVITLAWSWEDDSDLDARVKDFEKRHHHADLIGEEAEALALSQMINRMDGVKTRKREMNLGSRNQDGVIEEKRVDTLPLITFDKRTVVDTVSGRTSTSFVRARSEFRFPACR